MEEIQKNSEEKLEFLKREEIQTMEKDIAKLRETEAQKERERITSLKTEGEIKKEKVIVPPPVKEERVKTGKETSITLIPKPIRKPSPFLKILIRTTVVVVLFLIIGFFYWFFAIRKTGVPPEEITPPEEKVTPPIEEVTPPIEEVLQTPSIQERIVTWGFRIPTVTRTIDTIIIHSAYNTLGEDSYDVEKVIQEHQAYKVAVHFLVDRDGTIYRLAPDEAIAYHAGTGQMPDGSRKNIINIFSIGIELIYTKTESPNEAQYQSLAQIVKYLKQKYNIASENILANYQISPGRKDDPWNFDWEHFNSLIAS